MTDLGAVEARLRQVLEPYRARLSVGKEGPDGIYLELPGFEGKPWGYVAGTRVGKRYVSFYLMALYAVPELGEAMSPALQRRRQGKSCFNFTSIDEPLFAELEALTATVMGRLAQHAEMAAAAETRRR